MRFDRVSAYVFTVATLLAGCYSTGDVQYAGDVRVRSPGLIEIGPGVSVVADADEPLFYTDGGYWLYRDGHWLRSSETPHAFAHVELAHVPARLRAIERPDAYAQYSRHERRELEARNMTEPRRAPELWTPDTPDEPTSDAPNYPANAQSSSRPYDEVVRDPLPQTETYDRPTSPHRRNVPRDPYNDRTVDE